MRRSLSVTVVLVGTLLASATAAGSAAASSHAASGTLGPQAVLRVDQNGYLAGDAKYAALMSAEPIGTADVTVTGRGNQPVTTVPVTMTRRAGWSAAYPYVYGLRFDALTRSGHYHLQLHTSSGGAVRSPGFDVESTQQMWTKVLDYGIRFDTVQRDGADVVPTDLDRQPSHLLDRHADVYAWPHMQRDSDVITDATLHRIGGPVDVAGGWFDAGDYLKFTQSAAYADVLLLVAQRELGAAAPATLSVEARHGLAWLDKMWDPKHKVLYLQVGIGSGNAAGTFSGDHDGWRLPQADDHDTNPTDRYATHRPVFEAAAPGHLISPNLVGRTSAAFALAAQVDAASDPTRARTELSRATSLYAMANVKSPPHQLVTALPYAFYPETAWRDDMELGATEIARAATALHRPAARYVRDAATFAAGYLAHERGDTFNLYDVSALAHTDLAQTMAADPGLHLAVTRAELVADIRSQLAGAAAHAAHDAFGAGVDDTNFDVDSHTLGLVATATWYAGLTGSHAFDAFAAQLRGWVFGRNAWGVSFMVGIGSTFPHCMQHQVANLAGSVNGRPPLDLGAVVNGPNGAEQFDGGIGGFQDGMVHCPSGADRPTARPAVAAGRFDGSGSVYLDDVRSWQTDEPALDMTGAAIIAAAGALSSR